MHHAKRETQQDLLAITSNQDQKAAGNVEKV